MSSVPSAKLQPGTSENRPHRSERHVLTKLARDRDHHSLLRMSKLTVTSSGCLQLPSVGFQQPDQVPDFHLSHHSAGRLRDVAAPPFYTHTFSTGTPRRQSAQ